LEDILGTLSHTIGKIVTPKDVKRIERVAFPPPITSPMAPMWEITLPGDDVYYITVGGDKVYRLSDDITPQEAKFRGPGRKRYGRNLQVVWDRTSGKPYIFKEEKVLK
ncbi:MAG: hypothetical protein GY940_33195, partial [bacterium]|nr:hypothetical protein [bacterium]